MKTLTTNNTTIKAVVAKAANVKEMANLVPTMATAEVIAKVSAEIELEAWQEEYLKEEAEFVEFSIRKENERIAKKEEAERQKEYRKELAKQPKLVTGEIDDRKAKKLAKWEETRKETIEEFTNRKLKETVENIKSKNLNEAIKNYTSTNIDALDLARAKALRIGDEKAHQILTRLFKELLKEMNVFFPQGLEAWCEITGVFKSNALDLLKQYVGVLYTEEDCNIHADYINTILNSDKMLDKINEIVQSGTALNGRKYINAARKLLIRKSCKVKVTTLTFTQKGKDDIVINNTVATMEENEAIRKGFIKGGNFDMKVMGAIQSYNNFSKDVIIMDFRKCAKEAPNFLEFYVMWDDIKTKFLVKEIGDDYFTDMVTGKLTNIPVDSNEVRKFRIVGQSPSSLRKLQTLAFDVTEGYDNMRNILGELTYGNFSKELGETVPVAKMSKLITRWFSWLAPNTVFGQLNNYAIFFGHFCKDALDGMSFTDSTYYAECVSNRLGVKVRPQDVEGDGTQTRYGSSKVYSMVTNQKAIKAWARRASNNQIVYIDNVTPEESIKLDDAFNDKGEYAGKVVVFGKKGCRIEALTDLNGYKTTFNWGAVLNYTVLDIGTPGKCHTSIQMIESLLANKDNNIANIKTYFETLREEMFAREYEELKGKEASIPSFRSVTENFYPQDVLNCIAPMFLRTKEFYMFKKFIRSIIDREMKVANLFAYEIDGAYVRLFSDITRFVSEKGLLKFGEIYSPAANRFFESEAAKEKYASLEGEAKEVFDNRTIAMFKYPKIHMNEFYRARAISFDEMCERIDTLENTSKEEKRIIRDVFRTLKDGNVILPGNKLLTNLCAGLDFDFDGAALVFDPRFISMLPKEIIIVDLKAPKNENTKKCVIDIDTLSTVYLNSAEAANEWNIGTITICNNTQNAIYFCALLFGNECDAFNKMRDMLVNADLVDDSYTGTGAKYISGLPTRKVTEDELDGAEATVITVRKEYVQLCKERIAQCDIMVNDNLLAIFKDLNAIFRYYQEATIDSAKTGDTVDIEIAPGKNFIHSSRLQKTYELEWDYDTQLPTITLSKTEYEGKKTLFVDILGKIRDRYLLPNAIKQCLDSIKANVKAGIVYSEEEIRNLNRYAKPRNNEKRAALTKLNDAMFGIKNIYGTITGYWIRKDEEIDSRDIEDVVKSSLKAENNARYKSYLASLSNYGRSLMDQFHYVQKDPTTGEVIKTVNGFPQSARGEYLKFVSAFKRTVKGKGRNSVVEYTYDAKGGSSFAAKCFQEEYFKYVLDNHAEITVCGEKLQYNYAYKDGDKVQFNNGVAEYAAFAENESGLFTIKEFNGDFYAVQEIEERISLITSHNPNTIVFRINCTPYDVYDSIDVMLPGTEVKLSASTYIDESRNKQFDYAVYDLMGNKLANLNTQGKMMNEYLDGKTVIIDKYVHDVQYQDNKDVEGGKVQFHDVVFFATIINKTSAQDIPEQQSSSSLDEFGGFDMFSYVSDESEYDELDMGFGGSNEF